jgi:hypothetical protein
MVAADIDRRRYCIRRTRDGSIFKKGSAGDQIVDTRIERSTRPNWFVVVLFMETIQFCYAGAGMVCHLKNHRDLTISPVWLTFPQ